VDQLNREQLQAVMAHEFSHILNGDMRLNIKLIGLLNGILLIGLIGSFLFRSSLYSSVMGRRNKNSGALGVMVFALFLIVLGGIGTFFGNLIKAAVSRQREYLADASAVQFTRNPNGIAGALKVIGGYEGGAKIRHPHAAEVSHMFFASGLSS
jgi:Zn-dependent protease with chaperone function